MNRQKLKNIEKPDLSDEDIPRYVGIFRRKNQIPNKKAKKANLLQNIPGPHGITLPEYIGDDPDANPIKRFWNYYTDKMRVDHDMHIWNTMDKPFTTVPLDDEQIVPQMPEPIGEQAPYSPIYYVPLMQQFLSEYYLFNHDIHTPEIDQIYLGGDADATFEALRVQPALIELMVQDLRRLRDTELRTILRQWNNHALYSPAFNNLWNNNPSAAANEVIESEHLRSQYAQNSRFRRTRNHIDENAHPEEFENFSRVGWSMTSIPAMLTHTHWWSLYLWSFHTFASVWEEYNYLVTNICGTMLMKYLRQFVERFFASIDDLTDVVFEDELQPNYSDILIGIHFRVTGLYPKRIRNYPVGKDFNLRLLKYLWIRRPPAGNLMADDFVDRVNALWRDLAREIYDYVVRYDEELDEGAHERDDTFHHESIWIIIESIDFNPVRPDYENDDFLDPEDYLEAIGAAFALIPYPEIARISHYNSLHYLGYCTAEVYFWAKEGYPARVRNYQLMKLRFLDFLNAESVENKRAWTDGNIPFLINKLVEELHYETYLIDFETGRLWRDGEKVDNFDLLRCFYNRSGDIHQLIDTKLTRRASNRLILGYMAHHVFIVNPYKFKCIGPLNKFYQIVQQDKKAISMLKNISPPLPTEDINSDVFTWFHRKPLSEGDLDKFSKLSAYREFTFDIETYTGRDGQQIPYILSLHQFHPEFSTKTWVKGKDGCRDVCDDFRNYLIHTFVIPYRLAKDKLGKKRDTGKDSALTISLTKVRIWSFYGTKFDIHLINNPEFITGATWLGNPMEYKGLKYENLIFSDFFLFFPMSLEKLGQSWVGEGKKEHKDFDKITEETWREYCTPEMITYCEGDCELLGKIITKFMEASRSLITFEEEKGNNYGVFHEHAMTAPAYAAKLFTECYNKHLIRAQPKGYDAARDAYFGGFTQAFVRNPRLLASEEEFDIMEDMAAEAEYKRKYGEGGYQRPRHIYAYDILSSYPAAMRSRLPVKMEGAEKFATPINYADLPPHSDKNIRLLRIQWRIHPKYHISHLGVRIKGSVFYLRDTTKDSEYSWHWEYEIEPFAHRFEVLKVSEYQVWYTQAIFKEFVEDIYAKRVQAKADKNPALVDYYKLLMNSVYGKTGQKKHNVTLWSNLSRVSEFMRRDPGRKIKSMKQIMKDFVMITFDMEEAGKQDSGDLVHLASSICAIGRANLMKGIDSLGDDSVYYVDTDSIFTGKKLDLSFISDVELGKFKLENTIVEAVFYGPKAYYYTTVEGKSVKKIKGNRPSALEKINWTPTATEMRMGAQMQMRRGQGGEIFKTIIEKICTFSGMKRRWKINNISERGDVWDTSDLIENRVEALAALKHHESLLIERPGAQNFTKLVISVKKFEKFYSTGDDPDILYPNAGTEVLDDDKIAEKYYRQIVEMITWFNDQKLHAIMDRDYIRQFANEIFAQWGISKAIQESVADKLMARDFFAAYAGTAMDKPISEEIYNIILEP